MQEKCIVSCTGLGAMTLLMIKKEIMPIAAQLSFLIPRPNFNYRISTESAYAIPGKDGIILGANALEGSWNETPDLSQTDKVVSTLADVMSRLRA